MQSDEMKSKKTQHHQIRIIGGQWKRTPLHVTNAEGLRPTLDRVRETVFNWLNHLIQEQGQQWQELKCCDLFAGSGALGFEAASRGAHSVLMVELLAAAFKQLEQTKEKLRAEQIHLQRGDALVIARHLVERKEQFHLIFLDPPFHLDLLPKLLALCTSLLHPQGYIYVESEQALPLNATTPLEDGPDWCQSWNIVRQDKAGNVHYHLLQHR